MYGSQFSMFFVARPIYAYLTGCQMRDDPVGVDGDGSGQEVGKGVRAHQGVEQHGRVGAREDRPLGQVVRRVVLVQGHQLGEVATAEAAPEAAPEADKWLHGRQRTQLHGLVGAPSHLRLLQSLRTMYEGTLPFCLLSSSSSSSYLSPH